MPQELELGTNLNGYIVVDVLGSGGFGITYKVLDTLLQVHFAVKEYFPEQFAYRHGGNVGAREGEENSKMFNWGLDRFLLEARNLASVRHPNVVEVTRYFEANGTAYMAMKFEDGKTLDRWLTERKSQLGQQQIAEFLLPVLDGLEAIHATGLIHRDIKPQNIVLRDDGTPVLIDFGSARPVNQGNQTALTAVISPGFSPPEQYGLDSSLQGPWTDIYATAGIVYRAVSGENPADALMRVAGKKMPNASEFGGLTLTESFLVTVDKALSLDAENRPRSVQEFRQQLFGSSHELLKHEISSTAEEPTYVRRGSQNSNRFVFSY